VNVASLSSSSFWYADD